MKPKQIIPLQALKRISWDFPDIFPMIDDVVESGDLEMANRWDHKLVYAPVGLAHMRLCLKLENQRLPFFTRSTSL